LALKFATLIPFSFTYTLHFTFIFPINLRVLVVPFKGIHNTLEKAQSSTKSSVTAS
jgi:hypothetical protein